MNGFVALIALNALTFVLNLINIWIAKDYDQAKGHIIGAILAARGLAVLVALLLYRRGVL